MKTKKIVNQIAMWGITIGAINWGLDKFFQFNLVDGIFGTGGWAKLVYGLVSASGVYAIWLLLTGQLKRKK